MPVSRTPCYRAPSGPRRAADKVARGVPAQIESSPASPYSLAFSLESFAAMNALISSAMSSNFVHCSL
jgi:hypothetical protein